MRLRARLKRIPRQGCVSSGDARSSTPLSGADRPAPAAGPLTAPAQRWTVSGNRGTFCGHYLSPSSHRIPRGFLRSRHADAKTPRNAAPGETEAQTVLS